MICKARVQYTLGKTIEFGGSFDEKGKSKIDQAEDRFRARAIQWFSMARETEPAHLEYELQCYDRDEYGNETNPTRKGTI